MNSSGFSSKIFYFTEKDWLYQAYTYIIHNNKKTVKEKRKKNQGSDWSCK